MWNANSGFKCKIPWIKWLGVVHSRYTRKSIHKAVMVFKPQKILQETQEGK